MPQEEQFHRVFTQIPEILMHEKILNLDSKKWSIAASKKMLSTGRILDLLLKGRLVSGFGYKLIELKDVDVTQKEVDQVFDYCSTLIGSGEIPTSEFIEPIVLSTCGRKGTLELQCSIISSRVQNCARLGTATQTCPRKIAVSQFDPGLVLQLFREHWIENNKFFQMKPKQVIFYLKAFGLTHKVYRLYLNKITRFLNGLDSLPQSVNDLYDRLVRNNELSHVFYGKGKSTKMALLNYLAQCIVFGLVRVEKISGVWTIIALTERGVRFVEYGEGSDEVTTKQSKLLVDEVLLENPFEHGAILGICLFVESVFELSKNIIPVPHDYLSSYFLKKSGTEKDWNSDRGREEIPTHYGNISEQLGLVRRQIGKMWYITPLGIDMVVRFQLAKAVRMLFK